MLSIIRSSRLLCQSSAELIHDGAVVINGNRIEDVGPWESIKTKWQDALVTNLGDVTLMPGLFDCHCANAPLTVAGGHAHSMGGVCEGIEGVRAEVRKRAAEGANLIKVMATGGFMTAGSHPSKARFSQAEMDAIADEAKKAGLPVTTHATGTEGIERAAEARFNSIEHCAWISSDGKAVFDKAVARKLVEHDIAVCPTKEEFDAPNPVIERNPVAEFIANATAMGVDVCGVIPDDAVKVIGYQYAAEPVSKAWVWIRVQIDLLNTEDTRHKIEKRQGWANIGNGMFAQDWCKSNDRAGWFDNVIYGYICYVDLNMYSVGISYRGLRSNERLDFSKLSGNDCGATCLYSAGQNTPNIAGCFDS
ncbi:hypothetical protein K4K54_009401 [Colletotrichum sp. SAR 10_86]|nr:hypothetical protein K4K54_009401 [Colletotrichum sp. SAR 10_86]